MRETQRDGLAVGRLVSVGLLTAEVAVLAATGLWLIFFYRPSVPQGWPGIVTINDTGGAAGVVRGIHRWVARLALPTSAVAGALWAVDIWRRRDRSRRLGLSLAAAPALVVLVFAASFTGYLLPWDQLALWAVTVGTNMRGYPPIFKSSVKFVLVGGTEVSMATIQAWFLVHTIAISVLLAAALTVVWWPRRTRGASAAALTPPVFPSAPTDPV